MLKWRVEAALEVTKIIRTKEKVKLLEFKHCGLIYVPNSSFSLERNFLARDKTTSLSTVVNQRGLHIRSMDMNFL